MIEDRLIEHARSQLAKAAQKHAKAGMPPARAARAAIRDTQGLFPAEWRFGVQGDDDDDLVEVWEVEHRWPSPIASVRRYRPPAPKLTAAQADMLETVIRWPNRVRDAYPKAYLRQLTALVKKGFLTDQGPLGFRATTAGEIALADSVGVE
jgi:hypothetical protein